MSFYGRFRWRFMSSEAHVKVLALFALFLILIFQSCHQFSHVTTAELSCHVQSCDLIRWIYVMWERYTPLRDFDYELINNMLSIQLLSFNSSVPGTSDCQFRRCDSLTHVSDCYLYCVCRKCMEMISSGDTKSLITLGFVLTYYLLWNI